MYVNEIFLLTKLILRGILIITTTSDSWILEKLKRLKAEEKELGL